MMNRDILDKARGCLLGGAAGDALGYPVEFRYEDQIFSEYGKKGITEHELHDGVALISDDTQMTLFTADALVNSKGDYARDIYVRYLDWLKTQSGRKTASGNSELLDIPELYSRRAPGGTCLTALESGEMGTVDKPINNSKGCGGVMRVAPIGVMFSYALEAELIAADAAAITHGHELGYIPSAMLAGIISKIIHKGETIGEAVMHSLIEVENAFEGCRYIERFSEVIGDAVFLAGTENDDLSAIHHLGGGWVAEETLAIAVYCAMKYGKDFRKAVSTAVNHDGDSDSTGAVTGNIVGAFLGIDGIPKDLVDCLELKDIILKEADALVAAVR